MGGSGGSGGLGDVWMPHAGPEWHHQAVLVGGG